MTLLPVIARELRASARHPFTYYLRVLGAVAALLGVLVFAMNQGLGANQGGPLFSNLHLSVFCAIWTLVPLLTADCISRERREGTLGLLFLTRLRSSDIAAAKGLAHGLRAITLWLAVLPVVSIPMLLGGVGWTEVVLSAVVNFSAICLALAAGLVASAWSKAWLRALLGAGVLGILALLGLATLTGWLLLLSMRPGVWGRWQPASDSLRVSGLGLVAIAGGAWGRFIPGVSASRASWAMAQAALASVLALVGAVFLAGRKTQQTWREEPPSEFLLWFQETFCTPVLWVSFFRRWMRRKLEHNPIGWLEQRTWSGRLVTWGWFAVIVSLYSALLTDRNFFREYGKIQELMGWLLVGSLAMSAAGSFRRERETGVMELLLVSPLNEKDIIWGRLRGLWGQFLPAFALLLGLWLYFASFLPGQQNLRRVEFFAVTFLALPVTGLFFSLRCRNFITALLSTLAVGVLLPLLLLAAFARIEFLLGGGVAYWSAPRASHAPVTYACQLGVGVCCWIWLRLSLRQRSFPMERTGR